MDKTTLLLALLLLGTQGESPSKRADSAPGKRQIRIAETEATPVDRAVRLMREARAPGGVVVADDNCFKPKQRLFPAYEGKLAAALNHFVKTQPGFSWREQRGVYNLEQKTKALALLDTVIPQINLNSGDALSLSSDKLLRVPQVEARIRELGLVRRDPELGFGRLSKPASQNSEKRESKGKILELRHVTLRDGLNSLARERGNVVWILRETNCQGRDLIVLDWSDYE